MREETPTESMDIWVRTNNVVSCSGYIAPALRQHLQYRSFCMQGSWHSPKTLPTMVHGHAFRIIR